MLVRTICAVLISTDWVNCISHLFGWATELEQDLNTLEFSSQRADSMWNESFQFILFDKSVKTLAEQILSWIGPGQWTLRKTIHIYLGYATLYSSGVRWYIWLYPVWSYDWQGHYLAVSIRILTTWRVPCLNEWRNHGGICKFPVDILIYETPKVSLRH